MIKNASKYKMQETKKTTATIQPSGWWANLLLKIIRISNSMRAFKCLSLLKEVINRKLRLQYFSSQSLKKNLTFALTMMNNPKRNRPNNVLYHQARRCMSGPTILNLIALFVVKSLLRERLEPKRKNFPWLIYATRKCNKTWRIFNNLLR